MRKTELINLSSLSVTFFFYSFKFSQLFYSRNFNVLSPACVISGSEKGDFIARWFGNWRTAANYFCVDLFHQGLMKNSLLSFPSATNAERELWRLKTETDLADSQLDESTVGEAAQQIVLFRRTHGRMYRETLLSTCEDASKQGPAGQRCVRMALKRHKGIKKA